MSEQGSPFIRTITAENFRSEVLEKSTDCPVVLDFWADWCQPCRMLMPILEELTEEFKGRFLLAKVNVDEVPEIAEAFGVQGIPFVVAMVDQQPVSKLPGVLPKEQVREWIETFVKSEADDAYAMGLQAEKDGDLNAAAAGFRQVVAADPDNAPAQIALARVLLALDEDEECRGILEKLESRGFLEPEAEAVSAQLALKADVEESGGTSAARQAAENDPTNVQLQIALAEALGVDRKFDEACDILLHIVEHDRSEVRDQAKESMVKILGLMGAKSKAASGYRRRLATAFY